MEDKLVLGGKEFSSRFILGSGKYNLYFDKIPTAHCPAQSGNTHCFFCVSGTGSIGK